MLLTVFGVLAGALLLCARSGESHVPPPGGQAQAQAHGAAPESAHGSEHAVCVSPYDLPGCSPRARVTPGVLPVPPPAVTVVGGELPPVPPAHGASRIRPYGATPRAPGPYALQVLRT
ncbi:hypothetical protein ACGFZK_19210 [Streptomyces sp. NPDC048257]|uniref:hypothetical protein n=1 Tax=Streptomyces sp. NPDC048257 TaxID=3365526 RepID=UPI0037194B02